MRILSGTTASIGSNRCIAAIARFFFDASFNAKKSPSTNKVDGLKL
jgi:hypothetical protein